MILITHNDINKNKINFLFFLLIMIITIHEFINIFDYYFSFCY